MLEVEPLSKDRALYYISRLQALGFPVIWLRSPNQKTRFTPKGPMDLPVDRRGKSPIAEGWASEGALEYDDLYRLWGDGEAGYNIGIRTGRVADSPINVVVLDLDSAEAIAWAQDNLPETQVGVQTGRSPGQHWYYRAPPCHIGNRVRVHIKGEINGAPRRIALDVRGDGALVVAPGSIHGNGKKYMALLPWTHERIGSMPLFDPTWFGENASWEGGEDPKLNSTEGANLRKPPVYVDLSMKKKRALAYLAGSPGSVSGQGTASAECLFLARALVWGLCIPPEEAALIMDRSEWNTRCTDSKGQAYPWALDELRHKCTDAYRLFFDKPFGWMLLETADAREAVAAKRTDEILREHATSSEEEEAASLWWDFKIEEQLVEDPGKQRWPLTDTGNAERLVARFGESIRWCEDRGIWYVWDKTAGRWTPRQIAMERCSKVVARKINEEIPAAEEAAATAKAKALAVKDAGEDHKIAESEEAEKSAKRRLWDLRNWQKASESAGKRMAMIQMSASEPSISVGSENFDRHGHLLCVKNGVVDLRDGSLLAHDRDYYMTKVAPVIYDGAALAPTWEKCLRDWMANDGEQIRFLQRAAGYSITASTQCQCFFMLQGNGSNGKSVFLNALRSILGSYAGTAPAGLLMETRVDKATPSQQAGLATLVGKRLIVASESEESAFLSEAQVKAITCEDQISAKRMHENQFDFIPSHHVWLMTNSKPGVTGTDDGIWRRIHLVEWNVRIEDEERDNGLAEKLLAERSGILRWVVEGAVSWRKMGLCPPVTAAVALKTYRTEQDTIGQFLTDFTVADPQGAIAKSQFRAMYENWCTEIGASVLGMKRFAREMERRNILESRGSGGVRMWAGLSLKEANSEAQLRRVK